MSWFWESGGGGFLTEMFVISASVDIQNTAERADIMLETRLVDSI